MPLLPPIYAHPERVIAFAHVHYPTAGDGRTRIHAFGALEVILQPGTDVSFTRHYKVYAPDAGGDPFANIFELLHPDAYWVSAQQFKQSRQRGRQPGHHWLRHQMALHFPSEPRHQRHQIVRMRENALRAYAADYSISIAAPDAQQIEQARLIPDRAQAIWAAWVSAGLGADPDRHALLAAFQAWRKLDEQRVISF